MKKYWFLSIILLIIPNILYAEIPYAPPKPQPDSRFKADILLIVPHPDDETAVSSYLARAVYDLNKTVAIVYLNRGSGGGNSVGIEQSEAMARIREIEVRRATAAIGIDLIWFLHGVDTPGQDLMRSLTNWGHGENLEQVVRIVRLTRPEVIITWLPQFVAGENHGDHQASAVLAVEAFDIAGDPTVFPAQVTTPREACDINNFTEGLLPWQPKKIYFFSDAFHPIKADGPESNVSDVSPSQKVPYYQLAAKVHLLHRTQGDVSDIAIKAFKTNDYTEFIEWISRFKLIFGKSVVPCKPNADVFEGIQEGDVPFKQAKGYRHQKAENLQLTLGGVFEFYRNFWQAHDLEHLAKLVEPEIMISAGDYLHIPLLLENGTGDSVEIRLTATYPEGWTEVAGTAIYRLAPGDVYPVQTFFFAPNQLDQTAHEITWTATLGDADFGSVKMKVYLTDWTLPQ